MARFGYTFSGGAPVMKRYKIGVAFPTAGIFGLQTATTTTGLAISTSTSAANAVGLTVDSSTYTTTKATTMVEGIVTVIVNPDLVTKWAVKTGTAGTVLVPITASAVSSTGLGVTITTGEVAPNSPETIDGTIVGISGANTGVSRLITASSATVATVTVPFPYTSAVGDKFLVFPWGAAPGVPDNLNTNVTFDVARQDIAVGTGQEHRPVELVVDFSSAANALNNSFVLTVANDHIFNVTT